MFKETVAMSKAYVEARSQHGASELLDEIVAAKPAMDHTKYHSVEELRDNGLEHLRSAVTLLEGKATAWKLTTTGASSSPWRTRSRPHTGRTART